MADVSTTCDVVSSTWEPCCMEEALHTIADFIRRKKHEQEAGATSTTINTINTSAAENDDDDKSKSKSKNKNKSESKGGCGSVDQLRLVVSALADHLGGEDSEVCKRALAGLANGNHVKAEENGCRGGGGTDEEEDEGMVDGPAFELDTGAKTLDELVASVKRERKSEKHKSSGPDKKLKVKKKKLKKEKKDKKKKKGRDKDSRKSSSKKSKA
ncbi:hypothetical protein HOP50_05g35540 [Chloropicon primus]|uniref:Uncharacterized protein n=1 Tax=Chloropicon primus TaxID=1764295 RepID=A0A5B8MKV7_9CHLO|nr:hypothetical protein A3770_05p35470 [Chloropicon primus]UPR00240.1 hypothetical protein HOP50_05g35540 [Chloropicon primus]|mmetsp:Transcript_2374/g.6571  ORF Transcript_2374/g.6571 Transcript_2374/m.6571 type:complete len:213 (-) Transcript_2374:1055-1693(-)|eukprot:QDZ21029.1 hypothetical protein A3770_05p35470 [Chloropicon primus]